MVLSEKIMSPKEYLDYMVTNNLISTKVKDNMIYEYYINKAWEMPDLKYHITLQDLLTKNNLAIWDYPLSEIGYVLENDTDVVLVEALEGDTKEVRWYEVPKYEGQLISL